MKIPPIICTILFLTMSALYGAESYKIPEEFQSFSYEELLSSMPDVIEDLKIPFYLVAFVIFVFVLARSLNEAKSMQAQIKSISMVMIAIVAMITCKYFIDLGLKLNDGLEKVLKSDYYTMSDKLYSLAYAFCAADFKLGSEENLEGNTDPNTHGEQNTHEGGLEDQLVSTGYWDRLSTWFSSTVDATGGFFGSALGMFTYSAKRFLFVLLAGLFGSIIYMCSFLVVVMDSIRFFLIHLSVLLLPVIIAGLFTNSFRSQALAYCFSVLGNIFWPIGWAVGNLGTEILLKCFVNYCSSELKLKSASYLLDISSSHEPYALSADFIKAMMNLSFFDLTKVWCLIFLIACWSIIVVLWGPRMIRKFIQSGQDFFDSAVEGTTRLAGSAIGTAATGITAVAAPMAAKGFQQTTGLASSAFNKTGLISPGSIAEKGLRGFGSVASGLSHAAGGVTQALGQGLHASSASHWDPNNTANLFDGQKFIQNYKNKLRK